VVASTIALITAGLDRSAPQPVGPVGEWRVLRTVPVPGSGTVVLAEDSLWVVDTKGGELTADGSAPAGNLYRLDPTSGRIVDRIPGAVGGWPAIGAGGLWLSTAAGDLDVLTRVDLTTFRVSRVHVSGPGELPHGVAYADGSLWTAVPASGDVLRIDPRTNAVRQRIHLRDDAGQEPQSLVGDGSRLWVADSSGLVTRVDARTGKVTSRLQLPAREVGLVGVDPHRHVAYATSLTSTSLYQFNTPTDGPDTFGRELALPAAVDGSVAAAAIGPDRVWVATLNPDVVLGIDPDSLTIRGRVPLTGMDRTANVPVALAAGDRALWIRVSGEVVQLETRR
jgi:streptogramin lyase